MKKIVMLMGLCGMILHTGCKSQEGAKEAPQTFQITSPVQLDTAVINSYVCQIQSIRHIEVRCQEQGYLQHIYVDEGQQVKKGQLLFRIQPNVYRADLQKAQAEALASSIEVKNTSTLEKKNIVSPNELALAKAKYGEAKAEVALAQTHLGFTEIRAPFDGIVGKLNMKQGSLVNDGDLLTTLSDNSQMWVYFNVPEAAYLTYKNSSHSGDQMKVNLLMANNQLFQYPGVVKTIEADFNNNTGTIAFRATFPNPQQLLRDGETGNIQIRVPLPNALMIPQKATFDVLDHKYVYVIDKDSRVQQRVITTGAEFPNVFVVTSGLAANDRILLDGIRKVSNKQKIATRYEDPRQVLGNLDVYAE